MLAPSPRLRRHASPQNAGREQGGIAVLIAVLLVVMIGCAGLAVDLSRLYNRKAELQSVADLVALAAAEQLVGTEAGIDAALQRAALVATSQRYQYQRHAITWRDAALRFSSAPSGSAWLDAAAAKLVSKRMMFVRVDTAALAPEIGSMQTTFMRVLSFDKGSATTSARSVAGRSAIEVGPLAICALSPIPAASRTTCTCGELVQYGFRRGVGYDLVNLNPAATTPVSFVINPIDAGGGPTAPGNTTSEVVGPYVCSGSMPKLGLIGEQVAVSAPFPIGQLYQHLNSRFDQYAGGACAWRTAPPDANIKAFDFGTSATWMKSAPVEQTARARTEASKLWTVADPAPSPAGTTAPMLGLLWSYAKPVPFSQYVPGKDEPAAGYVPIAQVEWRGLYAPGFPEPKADYPVATPYRGGAGNHVAPDPAHGAGVRDRRVLNVPLLACPANADGTARVLAIGRFFMTVPASSTGISAEFAGLAPERTLMGKVELYK